MDGKKIRTKSSRWKMETIICPDKAIQIKRVQTEREKQREYGIRLIRNQTIVIYGRTTRRIMKPPQNGKVENKGKDKGIQNGREITKTGKSRGNETQLPLTSYNNIRRGNPR